MRASIRPPLGLLLAIAFLAAASRSGFAIDEPTKPDPDDLKLVARGKVIYAEHCASCHGTNLEGQPNWRHPYPMAECPRRHTIRPGTHRITRIRNCPI